MCPLVFGLISKKAKNLSVSATLKDGIFPEIIFENIDDIYLEISKILNFKVPFGTLISAISPTDLPNNPLPIGEFTDIFPDEIYVFTPQGEVIEMSGGSTAIDFAYAVHTDIGHHCNACRINKKLAPLSAPLESGQTIEILRDKIPQTSPAWLNFATTPKARHSIRNYLGNLKSSEARKFGKKLLEQSLENLNIKLKNIDKDKLRGALDSIGGRSLNRILKEIGLGIRVANIVAQQIAGFVNLDKELSLNSFIPSSI